MTDIYIYIYIYIYNDQHQTDEMMNAIYNHLPIGIVHNNKILIPNIIYLFHQIGRFFLHEYNSRKQECILTDEAKICKDFIRRRVNWEFILVAGCSIGQSGFSWNGLCLYKFEMDTRSAEAKKTCRTFKGQVPINLAA